MSNRRLMGMPLSAVGLLLLSAVVALLRAHYQLLGMDEYGFGLLGIAKSSGFGRLVHIQLTRPVSFDPIGYNALIYAVIHFFGTGAMTMRLPSIAGYLGMQLCLFWIVRRISNEWAATVALALPAIFGVVEYSIEARPYAVMLGLAALAVLSWQTAARRETGRTAALVTLAVALALAVNMQYYAVLLFVPLGVAEVARTVERRRVDLPMWGAIAGGVAGLTAVVPFAKALGQFQGNHNATRVADIHFVTHAYLWLVVGYEQFGVGWQHVVGSCGVAVLALMVVVFLQGRAGIRLTLPSAEAVLLGLLLAIPMLALVLAKTVTHFVEARYILPTMIGLCAVIAVLLTPVAQSRVLRNAGLALLFVAIAGLGVRRVQEDRSNARGYMASMQMDAATEKVLESTPGQPVYVTNHFVWEFLHYYSTNEALRTRLTLVYLDPKGYVHEGVGADVNRQMANMEMDGVPLVTSYEAIAKPGTERLFLLYHAPWEWTDSRLPEAHASVTKVGSFFRGELSWVGFPLDVKR